MSLSSDSCAYVTVVTNNMFFGGLKVMVKSLKRTKTVVPIYVVVPVSMEESLVTKICHLGVEVIKCEPINISKEAVQNNPNQGWNETFFKLNIMRLIQFEKIVFIDADTIVMRNVDKLFEFPSLSGTTTGKAGHPDWCGLNSGVMVLEPNENAFKELVGLIPSVIEDRISQGLGYGDQDVFHAWFPEWYTNQEVKETHDFGESYNVLVCYIDDFIAALPTPPPEKIDQAGTYYSLHRVA